MVVIEDYSRFINDISASRKPTAIRALMKLTSTPGMISLGGGLPNPTTFPIDSLQFTTKAGKTLLVESADLNDGLQYSPTPGMPALVEWLRKLQEHVHKPLVDVDICIGGGSQDVLSKAFDMLLRPGDHVLVESPAYVGILGHLKPYKLNYHIVPIDSQGLDPEAMHQVLSNWPDERTRPRVLYTVPVAGNPTGITTTLTRKREIYKLAQEYNVLILEDDPYFYLQFGDQVPSYLSLDTDGRVLRFDSLSKILSAGIRLDCLI